MTRHVLVLQRQHSLAEFAVASAAALVAGFAAVQPSFGPVRLALLFVLAAGVVFFLPPEALIALTLLVFATTTLIDRYSISFGPAAVYPTDVLVLLLAFRGAAASLHRRGTRIWRGAPLILFMLALLAMVAAAFRGYSHGTPLDDVVRRAIAVFYYPLLILSLNRIVDERNMSMQRLARSLGVVALSLIAWSLTLRVLGRPFETANAPALGEVATSGGGTVRRDFGSAAAFIVYPAVALTGIAGMAYSGRRSRYWTPIASIGILATLLTLVRGEIFALAAGAAVVLVMGVSRVSSSRLRTALKLTLGVAAVVATVAAVSPTLAQAVLERSLPGIEHQAGGADANKEYRIKAVEAGFRTANQHLGGLGVSGVDTLVAHDIDPGYIPHSGVGTLLIYGGWPAFAFALLTILALIRRSFQLPASPRWIHPAFVGVLTMLSIYSISAGGLAGDVWVIGLAAIAIAVRSAAALATPDALPGLPTGERTRSVAQ